MIPSYSHFVPAGGAKGQLGEVCQCKSKSNISSFVILRHLSNMGKLQRT